MERRPSARQRTRARPVHSPRHSLASRGQMASSTPDPHPKRVSMPIFINRENQSNKYWKYQVNGLSVHVSWGRIGGSAESQVKTFSSQGSMHAFISDKVSEKLRKGYREASENELQKEVQTA